MSSSSSVVNKQVKKQAVDVDLCHLKKKNILNLAEEKVGKGAYLEDGTCEIVEMEGNLC